MKPCIRCGAALPEEAAFCPYCTATQITRREIPLPKRRRRHLWLLPLLILIVTGIAWLLLHGGGERTPLPEEAPAPAAEVPAPAAKPLTLTAEGAAYPYCLTYRAENGQDYCLFTATTPSPDGVQQPEGSEMRYMGEGSANDSPVSLFVQNEEGALCAGEFLALMDHSAIQCVCGNEPCSVTFYDPDAEETEQLFRASGAMLYQRMHLKAEPGLKIIRWTLDMANGDRVCLEQTMHIVEQKKLHYTWQETPMNTAGELQQLFDSLGELGDPEEYLVSIELPAVTYDAPLYCARQVTLQGRPGTVFAGTLTLGESEFSSVVEGVSLCGSGGTGLLSAAPVYLEKCIFLGWDVAAKIEDGGSFHVSDCRFEQNGTALCYASSRCSDFTPKIRNCVFRQNDVAVDVQCLWPKGWLEPVNCTFESNGEDFHNPLGYRVSQTDCLHR